MDSLQLVQYSPSVPVLPQPALWVKIVVLAALTGWSALLAHKMIANFHDGVRPIYPELLEGRMSRRELARHALKLSLPFVIGFGLSYTLASGIIVIYLLLLPADVIGIASPRSSIAIILGALWGALMVISIEAIFWLAELAPVNFVAPMSAITLPVAFALAIFPALAVAFQFGPRLGTAAVVLALIVRQGVALVGNNSLISPNSAAMIAGILFLITLAVARDRKQSAPSDAAAGGFDFSRQANQVRRHLPWLMVQGALLALASRLWIFAGSEADFALLAQGQIGQAAVADVIRSFAFIPLIVTSALTTGIFQSVGFTLVFAAAFLSPHPLIAPLIGAAVIMGEVLILEKLDRFWQRYPSVRISSEHLRGSLAQVMELAILIGSAIAAIQLLPGGLGLMIFVALYILNATTWRLVYRTAAGPLAVLIIGLLANILTVTDLLPGGGP